MDDSALLAAFATDKSEAAFQQLVERHVGMVYSVCRRQLRDAHWAEDVTQAVFILLARKAPNLPSQVVLGGWLYRTAVYACSNARDLKRTRTYHEKLVTPMKINSHVEDAERAEMDALLDEGLMELNKAQREVLVLRFFENKPMVEVARMRKQSLYATQKSLDSGLARLRRFMAQRGVAVTAAVITVALGESAAKAIPAGLAATVGTAALSQTTALSTYVMLLVSHIAQQAGRAKLLASLMVAAAVLLLLISTLAVGTQWERKQETDARVIASGGETLTAAEQIREIDALWRTLRQAEVALRKMDVPGLTNVVAFTNQQQAENWEVMARVFAADQRLKQTAAAKFGAEGAELTDIKTFGERLDEVLPYVDRRSFQWIVHANKATLYFAYRDEKIAGGSIYFVKENREWKIDAGRSLDVVLEGLNRNQARVAMEELTASEQAAVLDKMSGLESVLTQVAQRIAGGQVRDIDQARKELSTVDKQSPGRAFFSLALRFDNSGQFRN